MKRKIQVIPNKNPHLGGLMPTPDWERYFELQASNEVSLVPNVNQDKNKSKVKTYTTNLKRTTER